MLYVSAQVKVEGEILAIIVVLQFPPKLAFKIRVIFESQYVYA